VTNYVATEIHPRTGERLQGRVHDDNTEALGGVSGHAGLFGSARDVAGLAGRLVEGFHGRVPSLSGGVVREFWRLQAAPDGEPWALGWMAPEPVNSSAGVGFPRSARGHTGFTGCTLWLAPEKEIVVALLTNRVYTDRADQRIRLFRPVFMDCLRHHLGWDRAPAGSAETP